MKLIIPMAGMGKRMRPHTLTVPKPLLPVAGEPIVKRLAEEITKVSKSKIEEIAFIIGNFGEEVEKELLKIAKDLGTTGKIYYQEEALGTAHAVFCAEDSLSGKVIVAFADTLFKADFNLDETNDSVIWTKKVDNPEAFGVVKKNEKGYITDFIEKPKDYVSDEAIIGIYYFKSGENLRSELKYLVDNDIRGNNEYQLTDVLENMKNNKLNFKSATVTEWLDCGNKDATVHTNQRILHHLGNKISKTSKQKFSVIIEPCFIDDNVIINNSVIGPYVSIGKNTVIKNSVISNSIIQKGTNIKGAVFSDSMIGNYVNINKGKDDLSIGDNNTLT
ncbi:MAG: hypothetical protein K8R54_17705 [Bacteroidales bacterium]|nr:hypothetical protein [Bacteroidales bacterium]